MQPSSYKDILRFITCGSVDDGKSTLIGRILYDTGNVLDDQYSSLQAASQRRGRGAVDLSFLTDGLKSEREQGITIDVAYRYFSSARRTFILADTPGHFEYTRNMVTAASNANLAVILVDARNGMMEQTFRHAFIASLMRIPHLVICINKMDLVEYSQQTYQSIVADFMDFASRLEVTDVQYIPTSALHGENILHRSANMPWYQGATLMYHLENLHIRSDLNHIDCRFPVQTVIRTDAGSNPDYRGYAGRVSSGVFRPGDEVKILPSGLTSRVRTLSVGEQVLPEAYSPMSVTMTLENEIDVSRGDMIVRQNNMPSVSQDIDLMVCWFQQRPLTLGSRWIVRHTSHDVMGHVQDIIYKMDVSSLRRVTDQSGLTLNDIGRIRLRTSHPLYFDPYHRNRVTGSVILIDEQTHETAGAGTIL